MKVLFLVFHGFEPNSGITKKIHYQLRGLRQLGHEVHLCSYGFDERGHRVRRIDDTVIADYGRGAAAIVRSRLGLADVGRWCRSHGVDMVYARSFHNASPLTVRLFRSLAASGIRVVMEIPTYPYDQEYAGFPWREQLKLAVDRLFRRRLAAATQAIVTFSAAPTIFGQRTIRISNGIDLDAIPCKPAATNTHHAATLHLTAVAEVHYWHGIDRIIDGLGRYYAAATPPATAPTRHVVLHIVGGVGPTEMLGSRHAPGFATLIDRWHLASKVVFHGQLFGPALDDVMAHTDLAIGSLARHRSGIADIKTLKNREYAARGIPFIYSETDADFDGRPYVMKVPPDESPIDIAALVAFIDSVRLTPADIRATVAHLAWSRQMQAVIDALTPSPAATPPCA